MHAEIDKNKIKKGLYIVSTPIGNLKDITLRAIEILRTSDFILCEDTRVSKKLLNALNIEKKLISNHKFNEKKNIHKLQSILEKEKIISLISDSGTPLISDPGKLLVEYCIKKKINIIPIPGPSSVISSISIAGFSNNFYFHGFLPEKINQIIKDFLYLSKLPCSIIFFISAKKVFKIEDQLKKYFLDRKIVICKELTKFYEEISRYEVKNLNFSNLNLRGEITIVLSQPILQKKTEIISESDKIKIKKLLKKLSVRDTAELMCNNIKISKSIIYKYCLKIKNEN
tara:strand:+ start:2342 stop:3196 length:855 start_codon:yes stop_codon:yes gene_type:complete